MALGRRVFKKHSVPHFAMILSLGCLGLNYSGIREVIIQQHSLFKSTPH